MGWSFLGELGLNDGKSTKLTQSSRSYDARTAARSLPSYQRSLYVMTNVHMNQRYISKFAIEKGMIRREVGHIGLDHSTN